METLRQNSKLEVGVVSSENDIGGAAQGVTISEVKYVVWQLPVLKMPPVLKIPKVTVSHQEALQKRE